MCAGARSARMTEAYKSSIAATTAVHTGSRIRLTRPCLLPTMRLVQIPAIIVRKNRVTMIVFRFIGREA